MTWLTHFLQGEEGPTAVEYAVLLALILIAIIAAIGAVGLQTGGMWGGIASLLQSHNVGS